MSKQQQKMNVQESTGVGLDDLLANPFGENEDTSKEKAPQGASEPPKRLIDTLPEESQQKAKELAGQIDPTNQQALIAYGTEAQSKLVNFSHSMLDHVQKKDIGPIGDILHELMNKLQQTNPDALQPEKKNIFSRMFGKVSNSIHETLSKFEKIGAQVDRIGVKLDHSKRSLLDDIQLLEKLYEQNKEYFHALNIYIAAAQLKLIELETEVIPSLKRKAEKTGDQMAYQEVNDMLQFSNRLEKRLHDLELSRQVTIQSAPQIRLIQNTNQTLAEKIQSSILTAIPLWKNQIAIAVTLFRQKQAVEAQKHISDTTNELLMKNSEMLKTNTIETAKENERGLIDIETLKKTQTDLIETLEEVIRIQEEGREKRRQAEQEFLTMGDELKQKLLEMK